MSAWAKKFTKLVQESEMYYSLRYEDVRGCPYNAFTPRSIAALTASCTAMAGLSLILGI